MKCELNPTARRHIYDTLRRTIRARDRNLRKKLYTHLQQRYNLSPEQLDAIAFEEKLSLSESVYTYRRMGLSTKEIMHRLHIDKHLYFKLLNFYMDTFVKLDLNTVTKHGVFPAKDNLCLTKEERTRLNEIRDIKIRKYKKYQSVIEDLRMKYTKAYSMKRHLLTSTEYDEILKMIDLERHTSLR